MGAFRLLVRWFDMDTTQPLKQAGEGQDKGPKKPLPEMPAPKPEREVPKPEITPEIEPPYRTPEIEPQSPDVVEIPGTPDGPKVNIPERTLPGGVLH